MDLQPVNQFEVTGEHEILASYEAIREVVNGITIDSSVVPVVDGKKTLLKGQPVAKMANGKYVVYNAAGVNGSENPTVLLKHNVDVTNGDAVVGGYEMAKVITERIPVTVDAALRGKMPFIQFA